MEPQGKAVFFLSDAHLGSGVDSAARSRRLTEFLSSQRGRMSHLYLLGDLFDFWFEYRHTIPKGHFQVLRALADGVAAGVPTVYLGGNHDFWCGTYLSREVGVEVCQHPIRVTHQGRRIFLAHGDGLGPGDTGYRFLKTVLRNPAAIALYRLIHPDLGIPLAQVVSRISRHHTHPRDYILRRLFRHVATPCYAAGDDAVLVGHIHDPLHLRDAAARDFLIVGDWLEHFSWVRLEDGRFTLEYLEGEAIGTLPSQPWPDAIAPRPASSPRPPSGIARGRFAGRSGARPPDSRR